MTGALTSGIGESDRRAGFLAASSAYLIWGFLPFYLKLAAFADVREVLGQRILWAIPSTFVALLVMSGARRGLGELRAALTPRMLSTLALSAIFIFVNWGVYVWLVLQHRVIEASLAYFLSPLVSVAIGVLFHGERIGVRQFMALLLAGAGVIVQGLALGGPPWMALFLCATWSVYAVIRKNAPAPAAAGLFVECLIMAPIAAGLMWWTAQSAPLAFGSGTFETIVLALAGPITAVPLMAFTFGARRVSFTMLGLLQFLAPSLQFLTGVIYGEPFTLLRGVSFVLIWAGLVFFAWDSLSREHGSGR